MQACKIVIVMPQRFDSVNVQCKVVSKHSQEKYRKQLLLAKLVTSLWREKKTCSGIEFRDWGSHVR